MDKNGEIHISKVGVFIIYTLLVIVILTMTFATLIKYDIIFKEDSAIDKNNNNNENVVEMKCTYSNVEDNVSYSAEVNLTFEDNKLKRYNDIEVLNLVNPNNDNNNELSTYSMAYEFMKNSFDDVTGVEMNLDKTDTSITFTDNIDLTKINPSQLEKEDGTSLSLKFNLDQSMDEAKQIINFQMPTGTCNK